MGDIYASSPLTLRPSVSCPALALVAPQVEVWHASWGEVVGAEGQWALAGLAGIRCAEGGIPKEAGSAALTAWANRVVFALLRQQRKHTFDSEALTLHNC